MTRVLVTGASGFIGAAVTRTLVQQGEEVAVLLRPGSDTWRIAAEMPQLHVIGGNLCELDSIANSVRDFRPEAVIHLGWDGVKGSERNEPVQVDNVAASLALYRLAESIGCDTFVGMGSQAEYGPVPGRLDESAPTRPTTVYGAAKLATCLLLERMASTSGRQFAWLRLFSSYGPGDDPSWMLQYVARSLLRRERPALTAAEQIWDYIHVNDVAGSVIATMNSRAHGVFNLGSGVAHKLADIVTTLRDLIDPSLPLGFGEVPYRQDQVMYLEADITRLTAATGWTPRVPLEVGLREVVDWLRTNLCPVQL